MVSPNRLAYLYIDRSTCTTRKYNGYTTRTRIHREYNSNNKLVYLHSLSCSDEYRELVEVYVGDDSKLINKINLGVKTISKKVYY